MKRYETFLRLAVSIAALSLVSARLPAAERDAIPIRETKAKQEITATFSIVAADPDTGVCGAAVASKYPAVGKVVPYVRAGVGAFCTQHWHNPTWGEKALDLLQQRVALLGVELRIPGAIGAPVLSGQEPSDDPILL